MIELSEAYRRGYRSQPDDTCPYAAGSWAEQCWHMGRREAYRRRLHRAAAGLDLLDDRPGLPAKETAHG